MMHYIGAHMRPWMSLISKVKLSNFIHGIYIESSIQILQFQLAKGPSYTFISHGQSPWDAAATSPSDLRMVKMSGLALVIRR